MDLNLKLKKSMKRCSFKVAKALKEAGYPQGITNNFYASSRRYSDISNRDIFEGYILDNTENRALSDCDIPTYLEVWLWLWREKHRFLECAYKEGRFFNYKTSYSYADPEETIVAAIEYLVSNKLLK